MKETQKSIHSDDNLRGGIFDLSEFLKAIGEEYGKTPAQVMLRWHIQHSIVGKNCRMIFKKSMKKAAVLSDLPKFYLYCNSEDIIPAREWFER